MNKATGIGKFSVLKIQDETVRTTTAFDPSCKTTPTLISFSFDPNLIISVSDDATISLWKKATKEKGMKTRTAPTQLPTVT